MSCIDVIAVQQPDNTTVCSPLIVRFSKPAACKQTVAILIDGEPVKNKSGVQFILDKGFQYGHFETPSGSFRKANSSGSLKRDSQDSNANSFQHTYYYKRDTNDEVKAVSAQVVEREVIPSNNRNSGRLPPPPPASLLRRVYDYFGGAEDEGKVEGAKVLREQNPDLYLAALRNGDLVDVEIVTHGSAESPVDTSQETLENESIEDIVTEGTSTFSSPASPGSESTEQPSSWSDNLLNRINSEHYSLDMMTPPFEWIQQLGLEKRDEVSRITFVSNGEMIHGKLYRWSYNTKIVISDVDGTITKSDVWGMLYTRMGRDYTHEGISKLYTKIAKRGYKFIYLTARPITQATATRIYIESIFQNKFTMPSGPVITTPNRLWTAVCREVIIRRPETFKISMLQCLKDLFPSNPFVAGFGNRPTDCQSYIAVGVDPGQSYRINPKGELLVNATNKIFSGYSNLEEIVYDLFPDYLKQLTQDISDKIEETVEETKKKLPPIPQELLKKRSSEKLIIKTPEKVQVTIPRPQVELPVKETRVDPIQQEHEDMIQFD